MYRYDKSLDNEFDLTIYVPTKGRPQNAIRLQKAFHDTTTLNTRVIFILSDNDDKLPQYKNAGLNETILVTPQQPGFVSPLNLGYLKDRRKVYSYALGFMGDDHLPVTPGWDEKLVNALLEMQGGLVYANDLFQGAAIPTSIIMSYHVPLALGYMTLPTLKHLYADNYWLDLGRAINKIKYLPDVVIEHLHPAVGKAFTDPGYIFSGSFDLDQSDRKEYERYLKEDLESDARIVSGALRRAIM
jgi:hypothetical protein